MTSKHLGFLIFTALALLAPSCGIRAEQASPASPGSLATSTLPALPTSAASDTPLPPLLYDPPMAPSATPVEGTSSTQINVRSEPSTAGNILGMIPPNTRVQIVGKDPGGNWWQIIYDPGVEGKGWVTAQYVTTTDVDSIPVIGSNATDPNNGNMAVVQQQIHVRSGPGTNFNSLGTLNAQDVVGLTGKDPNGAWLQIAFPSGPEGKGWVNAAFVRAQGVENLPIITEAGQVVGTGTPSAIPATPSPTLIPAWNDHDSATDPSVNVIFEAGGAQTLVYEGDISAPEGDSEDWINFKPYSAHVLASLTCVGSESLQVDILEDGAPTSLTFICGTRNQLIDVKPGSSYSMHLYTHALEGPLQYVRFTIRIQTIP